MTLLMYLNFQTSPLHLRKSTQTLEKTFVDFVVVPLPLYQYFWHRWGEEKKSDKASEVLNISIREKDGLPYKICRLCEGALNRFSEVRKMVNTQNQMKSKVITTRCKVFSPAASEPDKRSRVMEKQTHLVPDLFPLITTVRVQYPRRLPKKP